MEKIINFYFEFSPAPFFQILGLQNTDLGRIFENFSFDIWMEIYANGFGRVMELFIKLRKLIYMLFF